MPLQRACVAAKVKNEVVVCKIPVSEVAIKA